MLELLQPDEYIDSIFDIDLERIKDKGIKGLIIDIDNTLVSWKTKTADRRILDWFEILEKEGFSACLLSNNTKDRVVTFTEKIKVPALYRAVKPRKKAFQKAMKMMGTYTGNTAVIGDQIFTDIFGGNRLGLYTILVIPVDTKEFFTTRLLRRLEKRVIRSLVSQGKLKKPEGR